MARRAEYRMPRLYNFMLYIIFPLLVMVSLCFLFGCAMTDFESSNEISSNNESLRKYASKRLTIDNYGASIEKAYEDCLDQFQKKSATTGNLQQFMNDCTKDEINTQKAKMNDFILNYLDNELRSSLSFNWIRCANETTRGHAHIDQGWAIHLDWVESFTNLKEKYFLEGDTEDEAVTKALMDADGSDGCRVNINAGAIFWYTVMTTIGYGNTSPVTRPGRLMIYIFGTICIFVYGTIIGHSGYIILTIVDDFFCQVRLKRLTEGVASISFWFVMFILWLLLVGGLNIWWTNREIAEYSFGDALWFAFISVTTVGFGDFFILPEDVTVGHVFYWVFIISFGFIIFANIWLKLTKLIIDWMNSRGDKLDDMIKSFRLSKVTAA